MYEAVWSCTTCSNGQVVFVKRVDDGLVFAMCEECTQTYYDLDEQARIVSGGFGYDIETAYATMDDISARGCAEYVRRWVEPGGV